MSIYAFQNGGPVRSRYLCKNIPVADAKRITKEMHIDNKMSFMSDEADTHRMFEDFNANMAEYERERMSEEADMSYSDRVEYRKRRGAGFFKH